MKKTLLFLFLLASLAIHSQSLFFNAGKNFSKFKYHNNQIETIPLHSEIGNSLQFGYRTSLIDSSQFGYEFGLKIDEYNIYTKAPISAVKYNLVYLGIENAFSYRVFENVDLFENFTIDIKGGFGLNKLIYGNQLIYDKIYDLNTFPEFNGFFGFGTIGVQGKFYISEYIDFTIGYERSFSLFNTAEANYESLSFTNNQFKVGVQFPIN